MFVILLYNQFRFLQFTYFVVDFSQLFRTCSPVKFSVSLVSNLCQSLRIYLDRHLDILDSATTLS